MKPDGSLVVPNRAHWIALAPLPGAPMAYMRSHHIGGCRYGSGLAALRTELANISYAQKSLHTAKQPCDEITLHNPLVIEEF